MPYHLPPLPWLRAFEASARLGTFTLAAEELALTPAAISHQIRALEQRLGYPLFLRENRRVLLTRLGETYLPSVRRAFTDLSQATTDVFGHDPRSSLRIRCLQSFAQFWLLPRLPRFRAAYPELRLELLTASWAGTLDSEHLDLDICYGDGSWVEGQVEPLLPGQVLPLASPDLVRECPDLTALAKAPLIEITGVSESWSRFFSRQGVEISLPAAALVVDQSSTALALAAQGLGHCLVFDAFAIPYLDRGALQVSLPARTRTDQGMYLLHGASGSPHPALPQFLEWLRQEAATR